VLAHAPDESDGNWPCIPVRDLIDEIDSESLADGFVVGTLSKRGVHCKSLIDGGAQERALAARYEKHAIACEIDWPVTAAALRKVAERYERQAGSEDAKAEARRLGR
jgi:hypothetical protein